MYFGQIFLSLILETSSRVSNIGVESVVDFEGFIFERPLNIGSVEQTEFTFFFIFLAFPFIVPNEGPKCLDFSNIFFEHPKDPGGKGIFLTSSVPGLKAFIVCCSMTKAVFDLIDLVFSFVSSLLIDTGASLEPIVTF